MSKPREDVARTIEWLIGEPSKMAEDEIFAAFKAHIEKCEKPTIPIKPISTIQTSQGGDVPSEIMIQAWSACVEADRKKLTESLE